MSPRLPRRSAPSRAALLAVGLGALPLVLVSPPVQAFCGTYVGSTTELYNSVSKVVFTRFGGRSTITMANDISGDTEDFAVVVPVPEVPGEEDVRVVAPRVIRSFDAYSAPRMVSYECGEADADTDTDTDTDTDSDTDTDTDVDVEAQYIVGEYEVVILSADESDLLVDWLQDNEYAVPVEAEDLLQAYIDSGSYFFAAKVGPDAEIESGDELSPLQVTYRSPTWALPLRLGTLNSPGSQDLVVYTLNRYSDGEAGISTYEEAVVEDACELPPEVDSTSFTDWYGARLEEAHSAPGLQWVVEYSFGAAKCDPCSREVPGLDDLVSVAVPEEDAWVGDFWLTRFHLRYSPEDVTVPLDFYSTGITDFRQQRYIRHNDACDLGFPACTSAAGWTADEDEEDEARGCERGEREREGCSTSFNVAGLGLLGLLGLRRRRRRA